MGQYSPCGPLIRKEHTAGVALRGTMSSWVTASPFLVDDTGAAGGPRWSLCHDRSGPRLTATTAVKMTSATAWAGEIMTTCQPNHKRSRQRAACYVTYHGMAERLSATWEQGCGDHRRTGPHRSRRSGGHWAPHHDVGATPGGTTMNPVISGWLRAWRVVIRFVRNERDPLIPEREAELGRWRKPKNSFDAFGRIAVAQEFFDMDPPNSH